MYFCSLFIILHVQHSGSTFSLTVFCVWLNTSGLEANAEENHPIFKDKMAWCQNMLFSHITLQKIRNRSGDTKHTLHVH
jgi:hypothetical protein